MRTALLLALTLTLSGVAFAPVALACPDPEACPNPPPHPIDPLPGQCHWGVSKAVLYCVL